MTMKVRATAEARTKQQIPFGDDNKKSKRNNRKTGNNRKMDATAKDEMRGLSAARFTMGAEGRGRSNS
jgi:hypothetical protein